MFSSDLVSFPLGGADLLDPFPLSSLLVLEKRDSNKGFFPVVAVAPDGGFPPRLGGGLGADGSDFLLGGRGRTGGGGLHE